MRGSTLPKEKTRSADVIAFPARTPGAERAAAIPAAPMTGERPTLFSPALRDWLRLAILASILLHLVVYIALQLKFADDLERAAGAGAAAPAEGAVVLVPVEIVVEAALPPAPSALNAERPEAKVVTPLPQQQAASAEPVPPATVEAERSALPEDALAQPTKVESAKTPEAPATIVFEQPKRNAPARTSPSAAAAPARAAASSFPGRAGASGEAETGGRAAISTYQAQVLAHLSRHRVYPPEAQSRGITGIATVRFALASDGQVLSSALSRTSGASVLDEAAVTMVRRASPFPPIPPGLGRARMEFAAPIRFDLR